MLRFVVLHACSRCGCYDLRSQKWVEGWRCFKCGYTQLEYEKDEQQKFTRGIFNYEKNNKRFFH